MNCSDVRSPRYASAAQSSGLTTETSVGVLRSFQRRPLGPAQNVEAIGRAVEIVLGAHRVVEVLEQEREAGAEQRPRKRAITPSRIGVGSTGVVGLTAADTIWAPPVAVTLVESCSLSSCSA